MTYVYSVHVSKELIEDIQKVDELNKKVLQQVAFLKGQMKGFIAGEDEILGIPVIGESSIGLLFQEN